MMKTIMMHAFQKTIKGSLVCYLALSLVAPYFVSAQVSGFSVPAVSGSTVRTDLQQAFGQAAIDGIGQAGSQINDQVQDATSGIQTGNVITDAVAESVGGAIGSYLSCQIAGSLNTAVSGIAVASGLAVPTSDAAVQQNTGQQASKECLMDGLAFALKESLIKGLLRGLINYVNNGFDGSPAYVTNELQYLEDNREKIFEQYLNNPENFSTVCSAWSSDLRLALASKYSTSVGGRRATQLSGTGTGTNQPVSSGQQTCPLDNGGFASGEIDSDYWGTFLQRTTTTQGNPITSFFNMEEIVNNTIKQQEEKIIREIQRNDGFFDVTYCDDGSDYYKSIPGASSVVNQRECKTTTPGSVLNQQLNNALGSDQRRIEAADEINELFSALVGQLVKTAFSKIGLYGTSQRTSGSQALTDQYANEHNPAVVAGSRDQLLSMINEYANGVIGYIKLKRETINFLFRGYDATQETRACYYSKYNTWVNTETGQVIPADQVDSIPANQRTRAVFTHQAQVSAGSDNTVTYYLGPEQSIERLKNLDAIIGDLSKYINNIQKEVEDSELNRDKADLLKIQLGQVNNSDNPLSAALADTKIVKLISEKFAAADTTGLNMVSVQLEDGSTVQIPRELTAQQLLEVFAIASEELTQFDVNAATTQRRLIEIAINDMIQGKQISTGGPRQGGQTEDLNYCKLFSHVDVSATQNATSTATSTTSN